jgi:hypothetical protein
VRSEGIIEPGFSCYALALGSFLAELNQQHARSNSLTWRGPIVRQQATSRAAKAPAFPRKRPTQLRQRTVRLIS